MVGSFLPAVLTPAPIPLFDGSARSECAVSQPARNGRQGSLTGRSHLLLDHSVAQSLAVAYSQDVVAARRKQRVYLQPSGPSKRYIGVALSAGLHGDSLPGYGERHRPQ